MFSKLTINAPQQRDLKSLKCPIVNFEHIKSIVKLTTISFYEWLWTGIYQVGKAIYWSCSKLLI